MNPYAYQQAQLPQQQPQQYQYQAQYAQQQPYYYVQPAAQHQAYQTPQQYSQYGTIGYQTPQTATTVAHYSAQGYPQVAGGQQYVAASVTGQNFYATTAQVNQAGQTAVQPPQPQTASDEQAPPLPPEQSDSSSSALPPPLPPEPAPTSTTAVEQQISEAQKQYQEKLVQWQQQYAQWQAQHQNHPDQKQYQEWQKQMSQWQQHNQTLLQMQGGDNQHQQTTTQQQAVTGAVSSQGQGQTVIQQQPYQTTGVQQGQQQPYQTVGVQQGQQQPYQTAGVQQGQQQRYQTAGVQQGQQQQYQTAGVQQGQQQLYEQYQHYQQQQQPYQQQEQQQQQQPYQQKQQQQQPYQQQEQHQPYQQQQPYQQPHQQHDQQQQTYPQQQPHQQFLQTQQHQPSQTHWAQNNSLQNQQDQHQQYDQQQGHNYHNNKQQQQQRQTWKLQNEQQKKANWMQNQKGSSNQSSQNYSKVSLPKTIPELLRGQPVPHKATPQQNQLPNWMQSGKTATTSNQPEQNSRWAQPATTTTSNQQQKTAVTSSEAKQLPKWLKVNQQQQSQKSQQQEPRWLQEKLEKTEQEVKKEAAERERAVQESEAQKKQVPKWLQDKAVKSDQAQAITQGKQAQQKPIPKWLNKDKPLAEGKQAGDQQKQAQVPKWLQSQTSAAPATQTSSVETSAKKQSKWDKSERNSASASVTISPHKLDPLKELELLRQQQVQLQQLQQLENRLKQTTSASSVTAKPESSTVISTSKTEPAADHSWSQYSHGNQSTPVQDRNKTNTADQSAGFTERNLKQKGLKQACKFFPNCRFGISCHFQHPPCKFGLRCTKNECIFDHSADSSTEEYPDETQYQGDFPEESGSYGDSFGAFSGRGNQIPGIGDGELPVVPAITEDNIVTGGEGKDVNTYQDNSFQDNTYDASQEDYMEVENDQHKEGEQAAKVEASVPTDSTHSAPNQSDTQTVEWPHHDPHWEGPPYHQGEHTSEAPPLHREKPPYESDWPPPGERYPGWEDEQPPQPRQGEHHGETWHRGDWRSPYDRSGRESQPHFPRDERDFGPPGRDRRPPFPGDEPDRRFPLPPDKGGRRPPWIDDARPPFPRDERDRPPFPRDERHPREDWDGRPRAGDDRKPPIIRSDQEAGEREADHKPPEQQPGKVNEQAHKPSDKEPAQKEERDRPPLPREEHDRPPFSKDELDRPPFLRNEQERPPFPGGERDQPPFPGGVRDRPPFPRDEQDQPPFPGDEQDRPPFSRDEQGRPPFPRDERERPPFPRDEWDRPPFPRDERDRPPFPRDEQDWPPFSRDERDRPPFPRDMRDRPPFLRDGRDRPPFPRDERDWPPVPRDDWDRPPFPRGERDSPFPPRGGRDRWPSPPRDERERWPPFPRDEMDEFGWSRERGPPGRPLSPPGRSGRGRPPFHEDERGRPISPPPWPPRGGRSPPGRDFRGRPPPPEEFDRFGRPLPPPPDFFDDRGRPPPRDWDRRDFTGRRPLGEERFREPPYPDDHWRRSPPPYRDHPDRFPPDHPRERERDDRRGPDDRFYDERLPPDRRPPFDEYYRDRPPYPEEHPPHDPAAYPPHPDEGMHPNEAPRVEKKPETVPVESILDSPGRESRPDRIVIILRGPPGSGKTHVARLIKDKEVSYGAHAPRILALDDYFLMEVEKSEQDPDTGKKVKKKVTEYVYEEEMEEAYRASLFKSFTKTLEDGFFPVVIVDAIHDKVEHFEKYWSHAKQKGFEITFRDSISPSGKFDLKFDLRKFEIQKNDFTKKLENKSTAKEFIKQFKKISRTSSAASTPSTSGASNLIDVGEVNANEPQTPPKRNTKKRKNAPAPTAEGAELPSPQKLLKPNTLDEEIEAHYIGHFNLKVALLSDCPPKWLDRSLDEKTVDELSTFIASNPTVMHNAQPWLGIADITKEELKGNKDLIKGATIYVIGGRHRHAAYKKVSRMNVANEKLLEKIWINVYDNRLTDEQTCRLAAKHNTDNHGSRQTSWMERVATCRNWLFKMAKVDPEHDAVPASSTAWKKACQQMYMEPGKDVNGLEPTLQAALLPRVTYDMLLEVSRLFQKHELKGMKKEKPSRKRATKLTQNQIGMPLQGLEPGTKDELLQQVISKQVSLKEMRQSADRLKHKAKVVKAFLKFTGEKNWESLRARFPQHATEEKMAQFNGVLLKRGVVPPVLESFFRRALAWEEEKEKEGVQLSTEKDGIFFFTKKEEIGDTEAILLDGALVNIPIESVKTSIKDFKGCNLSLVKIEKDTDEKDIRQVLMQLHAMNIDSMQWYNIIAFTGEETLHKTLTLMEQKMVAVQKAYWNDTSPKTPQGNLLQNSLHYVIIGHWSAKNVLVPECCNFGERSASNVFSYPSTNEADLPASLLESLMKIFSFEGQWILDLTKSNGAGIVAGLASRRNVVCLEAKENLRSCATAINALMQEDDQGPEDDVHSSGGEEDDPQP